MEGRCAFCDCHPPCASFPCVKTPEPAHRVRGEAPWRNAIGTSRDWAAVPNLSWNLNDWRLPALVLWPGELTRPIGMLPWRGRSPRVAPLPPRVLAPVSLFPMRKVPNRAVGDPRVSAIAGWKALRWREREPES